jgi:hypothetical protein
VWIDITRIDGRLLARPGVSSRAGPGRHGPDYGIGRLGPKLPEAAVSLFVPGGGRRRCADRARV